MPVDKERLRTLAERIKGMHNADFLFKYGGDTRNPNEIRPGESIAEWKRRITKQNASREISGGQIIPSVVAASPQTKKGRYLMEKAIRPGIGKISSSKAEQLIEDFGDAISGTPMIITDPDVAVSLAYAAENLPNPDAGIRETQYNNAKQAYLDSRFPGNDLFSQVYRWWRRKAPHKPVIEGDSFSGMGADIVSLNNNVIRLTPESKQSNALVNEFVESKYPSVMTAAEYKSDPNRIIGDQYRFPVSNVNFFAGIEDGKFRIDTLDNFNDDTVIFPARNIKKDVPEIYGIRIDRVGDENYGGKVGGTGYGDKLESFVIGRSMGGIGLDEGFRAYLRQSGIDDKKYEAALDDAISQYISEPNKLSDYSLFDKAQIDWNRNYAFPMQDIYAMDVFLSPGGYRLPIDPVGWEQAIQDFGNKETDELRKVRERNYPYVQYVKARTNFWDVISNNYPMSPFNSNPFEKKKKETKYGFVDKDGNLHPISEYNASVLDGKTVIGNPNGSIFIGRLQDISKPQLDSLNAYLKDNPSRILRTDLGSFNQYKLDSPSLETYLEQYYEHPKQDDPNVFVIGTTEPNTLWNAKASGGKIHIKPSHRGRLTELKERTGKTEAELYNDGNPAHKKMIVFARNARKWHSDGGLLHKFDGGGKFMTVSSDYTPLMYTPSPEVRPDVPIPTKYIPQPDNGDYEYPSSTGMLQAYPITTSVTSSPRGFVIADEVPGAAAQAVYNDEANKAAREERMWRQWYAESAFNNSAKSPAGAQGAFQIMPITYKDYLGRGKGKPGDLNNPAYNRKVRDFVLGIIPRDLGAFWSDDSSDEINLAKRYAAYNWGAGSLRNYLRKKQKEGVDIHNSLAWLSGLPKETRDYVNFIVFNQDVPDTSKTQALYEAARKKYNGKSMGGVIEKLSKMYGNDRAAMLSALRKNRY